MRMCWQCGCAGTILTLRNEQNLKNDTHSKGDLGHFDRLGLALCLSRSSVSRALEAIVKKWKRCQRAESRLMDASSLSAYPVRVTLSSTYMRRSRRGVGSNG
jgi:hypothetical protein